MIGMICAAGAIIAFGVGGIKSCVQNEQARKYPYMITGSNVRYYYDRNHCMRNAENNEPFFTQREYATGDLWYYKDTRDRGYVPVRNLSREWRDNYYEKVRGERHGFTVINDVYVIKGKVDPVIEMSQGFLIPEDFYCYGQKYRDIESGDIYTKRTRNYCHEGWWMEIEFYVKVSTMEFVRLTDEFLERYKDGPIEVFAREGRERWEKYEPLGIRDNLKYKDDFNMRHLYWECFYRNQNILPSKRSLEEFGMMGNCRPLV